MIRTDPAIIKQKARMIAIQRALVAIMSIGLVLVLSLLVFDVFNGLQSRRTLVDCTITTGKCYQENARRTEAAIADIAQDGIDREVMTRATITATVACADRPEVQTYKEIESCVLSRLDKEENDGKP